MDAVFSGQRTVHAPSLALPDALKPNTRLKMDGIAFLSMLPAAAVPVAFLDPQYRGVLEKLSYGNEGKNCAQQRCALEQMTEATISHFMRGIDRALMPSGHLFLWVDKFHLCQGVRPWLNGTSLAARASAREAGGPAGRAHGRRESRRRFRDRPGRRIVLGSAGGAEQAPQLPRLRSERLAVAFLSEPKITRAKEERYDDRSTRITENVFDPPTPSGK